MKTFTPALLMEAGISTDNTESWQETIARVEEDRVEISSRETREIFASFTKDELADLLELFDG